jgi:hemoglobin-like flavoprotein
MPCPFSQFSRVAPGESELARPTPVEPEGIEHLPARPAYRPVESLRDPQSFGGVLRRLDGIDRFALVLLGCGVLTFLTGMWMEPPGSFSAAVEQHYPDWAPGLVTDGILLLVVNSILRRHERRRVLSQVGSLSREFALDAVRRARGEGWLTDGSLNGMTLARASLEGVDLSEGRLEGIDLSYSDLRGATLAYADLRGADLTGTDMSDADLRWADLRGAVLRWSDLRGAMLDGALLEGVDARFASVDPRLAGMPDFSDAVMGGFLDATQIGEVRRTFDQLVETGPAAIERFYDRLFRDLPEARVLFRSEPRIQARKFLQSLKVIVSALHMPQRHVTVLQRLGERHGTYGVRPEHYPVVSNALLSVLEDALGPAFTPDAKAAWERAFTLIATVMIGGASEGVSSSRGSAPPHPGGLRV